MNNKTLRIGVIGLGVIGNKHSDMYQSIPQAELVGVCDWNKERADAASAHHAVTVNIWSPS